MIKLSIPGREKLEIAHVVFDVNGTIAFDGHIDEAIKRKIKTLTAQVQVYLLTADTYGMVEQEMGGTGVAIQKVNAPDEDRKKEEFVEKLGAPKTIAVGNGANDAMMLRAAALGICVVDGEGACSDAVVAADMVVYGWEAVFGLLENPQRIIATLRR